MIPMLLFHPVALLFGIGVLTGTTGAFHLLGLGEPPAGAQLLCIGGGYLFAARFLPWWTRPIPFIHWTFRRIRQ